MKKVRLLPFILALSLPLAGCDKKEPDKQQTDKVVSGILLVHAPSTIGLNETLTVSSVTLDLSYSDGTTSQANPERVSLDTSSLGIKEGIAFYGSFYKTFSIEVVEAAPGEKSFVELKDDVLQNHNYTLDVVSYYKNFPTERYEGNMYNISDKAYYGTDPNYLNLWESGYIKVKDQGIAKFYWSIANQEVSLEYFVISNPARGIYDIESCLVEFLLESSLTKVDDNHYTSSNSELIGMMSNFSGLELTYIQAPDHLDIYKVGSTLKVEFTLTATYYDEETLDPVENEPVYVGVTIKNIGSTHNSVIEAFVEDPSKKVPNPTQWDAYEQSDFHEYYDDFVPPFPTGASYSFSEFADWDGYEQKHFIKCQDLASGDLRSSYAAQLTSQGFELEDGVYRKRVQNSEQTLEKVYEAEMKFYSPSASYAGHTYGYYYTSGVFQVVYTMYTQVIMVVNTVEKLNTYIASTAAASIVPVFPEAYNTATITKFDDRTEIINQLYPDSVLFATSSTGLFRIYLASFADATAFYNELLTRAAAKGFDDISSSNGLTVMLDSGQSKISISDVTSLTADTYSGYLQCQIYIRNNYTEFYSVTINKDDGVASSTIISPYNYMKVEEGTKVTFSFTIVEGNELDEITSNAPGLVITKDSTGTNQYYFNMPAQNVTISISTRSKAAEEGLEYDREYFIFVGRNDEVIYYERPTDQGSNKFSLVFNEDGTGTFTKTWYLKDGSISGTPNVVTFTYTLVNGEFKITCVDGTDNAVFAKYRLFEDGEAGSKNNTGSFADGEITISLTNGNGSLTEVTFK